MLMTEQVLLDTTEGQASWFWEMSRVATILYDISLEQRRGWWLRYHGTRPGIGYNYQNGD